MSQPKRLQFLAQLYQDQAQQALENLARLQQQRQQLEQQISQLHRYWQDYQDKLHALAGRGARAGQLLEFRAFIDKLETAIRGQEQQLTTIHQEWQQASEQWQTLHFKSKALTEMADKANLRLRKAEDSRLQKEQDDRSANQFRAKIGLKNA